MPREDRFADRFARGVNPLVSYTAVLTPCIHDLRLAPGLAAPDSGDLVPPVIALRPGFLAFGARLNFVAGAVEQSQPVARCAVASASKNGAGRHAPFRRDSGMAGVSKTTPALSYSRLLSSARTFGL